MFKVMLIAWFTAWGQPAEQVIYFDTMADCVAAGKQIMASTSGLTSLRCAPINPIAKPRQVANERDS